MKRRPDLIDQFADLVIGADDPRRLAERTLEVIMSLLNGRSGAVFSREGERLTLFASRGIDQHVLDSLEGVWSRSGQPAEGRDLLRAGAGHRTRLPRDGERAGVASFAVVPVLNDEQLIALVYVGQPRPALLLHARPRPHGQVLEDRGQGGHRDRTHAQQEQHGPRPGRPTSSARRSRTWSARSCCCCSTATREHRARGPADGRHAEHHLPAAAALQHPAPRGAQDASEGGARVRPPGSYFPGPALRPGIPQRHRPVEYQPAGRVSASTQSNRAARAVAFARDILSVPAPGGSPWSTCSDPGLRWASRSPSRRAPAR